MQMWDYRNTGHPQIHGKINANLHIRRLGPTKQNRGERKGVKYNFKYNIYSYL